jgi:hypothetical protein
VFRPKRADRIKLIVWDGTCLCLFAKRLEQGTFCWPKIENGVMRLTPSQLAALIEGLDWMPGAGTVHPIRSDPICKLPYGPATLEGRDNRPDRCQHPTTRRSLPQILLASAGASTDVSWALTPDIRQ